MITTNCIFVPLKEDPEIMKQKLSVEQKDKWHEDPKNWFLGFLYFNRQDQRVLVPKKNPYMGWTINFANIYSYLILALIVTTFTLLKIALS